MVGQFFCDGHSQLARPGYCPTASLRQKVSDFDIKVLGGRFLNVVDGYLSILNRK